MGLHRRAGSASQDRPKEPAEATGELQWPEPRGCVCTGGLNNPYQEVDGGPEDVVQERRVAAGRVEGLGEEVGHHVAGKVEGLVTDPIAAWSASARVENVPKDAGSRGGRNGGHRRAGAEVVVEDGIGSGRQGGCSSPDVFPAFPKYLVHVRSLLMDSARGVAHSGDRGKSPKHHTAEAEVLRESGAARAGAANPGLKARAALSRRFKPPHRKPGGSVQWIDQSGSAAGGGRIAGREASREEPSENASSDRSTVSSTGSLT
jgi:hypothetical protein